MLKCTVERLAASRASFKVNFNTLLQQFPDFVTLREKPLQQPLDAAIEQIRSQSIVYQLSAEPLLRCYRSR
ncbi:hypothetical protein [Chamaesiphon sp. VAR_69_metabat_338]|uniref:hypothetical protein n=1 Tax=Chamaesiphon sp. VAR_69_metabat_338 TaxID=2964704 RepID=UPI00286E636F|nr:hypothetical protein [Chamaesiphon sp. VAR_69_metabat_338]